MNKPHCPYCTHIMHYEMNTTGGKKYACLCRHCDVNPHSQYTLHYNSVGKLISVAIILLYKEEEYMLDVFYEFPSTRLSKLKPESFASLSDANDGVFYHSCKPIIDVDEVLPFDLQQPIESGMKILNRLMGLVIFS